MAFYGCHFSFDGVSCFEHGLMIYDLGSPEEDGRFSSAVEIQEDRTSKRYTPLHYGVTQNTPLTFSFTFGADMDSIDGNTPLDRWDIDVIAHWLTGHEEYKWLEITQPDMEAVRYRCIISDLEYHTYGKMPWAFTCQVTCDSPFAYTYPEQSKYSVSTRKSIQFECRTSSLYYYPKVTICGVDDGRGNLSSIGDFKIINHTDGDREFSFSELPSAVTEITIDNENEIITNSADLNIYGNSNLKFLRLKRGLNQLEFIGNGTVILECTFPINIGG